MACRPRRAAIAAPRPRQRVAFGEPGRHAIPVTPPDPRRARPAPGASAQRPADQGRRLRPGGQEPTPGRLSPARSDLGRSPGADPLPRRTLPNRRQEPRSTPAPAQAGGRGVGVHQRQLPARVRRAVPEFADRRKGGDRVGALTRREVRRRPVGDHRGRKLGRRPPGLDGSTDGQRARFPARP